MQKILEVKLTYHKNDLVEVYVLVDFTSSNLKPLTDVRAIYSTSNPHPGYHFIRPDEKPSEVLFQEVANYGFQHPKRDKIFPGWKKKVTMWENGERGVKF